MRLYVFDDQKIGVQNVAGRLSDVTHLLDSATPPEHRMGELIARWSELREEVLVAASDDGGDEIDGVIVRAPLQRPGKVLAAPVNYRRHQQEMGGGGGVYEGAAIATIETYGGFIKATTSIVGPDGAIVIPFAERRVDHEAELGVVIGRHAYKVGRDDALSYVFGYVPLLDITVRGAEDRSYRKSFDTFTPIGPAIVTADEVPDPGDIHFQLDVNGELRQHATTADLIFDVPKLIEYYSEAMTLEPGDIIATGTPEGVGPIVAGDVVRLVINGIGELIMPVEARGDLVIRP